MTDPSFNELIHILLGPPSNRPSATELLEWSLLKSENISRRESNRTSQYDDSPPVLTCFEECDENEFTPVTNYCKVWYKWTVWYSYLSLLMKMKSPNVKIL